MSRYITLGKTYYPGNVVSGTDFVWYLVGKDLIDEYILFSDPNANRRWDDAPILTEARLWCNFADGLVYKGDTDGDPFFVPSVALWMGDIFGGNPNVAPTSKIQIHFHTLNEWYPVNMAVPRNNPSFAHPDIRAWFLCNTKFLTNSINPVFNGQPLKFSFQFRFQTALR